MLSLWITSAKEEANVTIEPSVADANHETEKANTINMQFLEQFRELDPLGGLGLIKQIMQVYLDTAGDTLQQIELAVAVGDADGLRRGAHTLKSSSANVGAETLSGFFQRLEALGREGKIEEAKVLLKEMNHAYTQATQDIRTLVEEVA